MLTYFRPQPIEAAHSYYMEEIERQEASHGVGFNKSYGEMRDIHPTFAKSLVHVVKSYVQI
jgi:hypothetical protein